MGEPRPTLPPPGRMDSVGDTLQRLRETFSAGRTRPAEFRATQLEGLGRFLRDNKQLLQEALARDLRKVSEWGRRAGVGAGRRGVGSGTRGWAWQPPPQRELKASRPSLGHPRLFSVRPVTHFFIHSTALY